MNGGPVSILDLYLSIANSVAPLDHDLVKANLTIAIKDLPEDERKVSLESAMFIANNAGPLFGMIIRNFKNCRNLILDAINTEVEMDDLPVDKRAARRSEIRHAESTVPVEHFMEIGVSVFSPNMLYELLQYAINSFGSRVDSRMSSDTDSCLAVLTDDDKTTVSLIFSNFMFIIRALNNNPAFFNAMMAVTQIFISSYEAG